VFRDDTDLEVSPDLWGKLVESLDRARYLIVVLSRRPDSIFEVRYSSGGERIASASMDGTVGLWDADTGQALTDRLTGHWGPVNGVAFSPDGKRLASAGGDTTVRLWDIDATPEALCDKLTVNMSRKTVE
jgi:WD40 repeat protein